MKKPKRIRLKKKYPDRLNKDLALLLSWVGLLPLKIKMYTLKTEPQTQAKEYKEKGKLKQAQKERSGEKPLTKALPLRRTLKREETP
jgi:hypothetical protein